MSATVRVLVDRVPTNMQVGRNPATARYPDLVLCVDQDSGFIYQHELLQPDEGDTGVGMAAEAALGRIHREAPGARVVWVTRREPVAAALAARFAEADVWSESGESFRLWDEAYVAMDRQFGSRRGVLPYLWRGDVTAEEVAALFEAAARFYQTKPWESIPDSELIQRPNPDPGGRPLLFSVMGAVDISRGLVLFDSQDDHRRVMEDDRKANVVFATLEDVAQVPNTLRSEAEQHGWQLADKSAFPELMRMTGGEPGPCSGADLRKVTAAFRALAEATKGYRDSGINGPQR